MSLENIEMNIKDLKPKVSVIVPVYNVEPWIRRSLDSLVNQTLKEIEIVIIDDGSSDKCPEIIDEYAKKDSRIVVIHQKNQGYGSACHNGMLKASGEYIGFTDPDDYVDLDFYEKLYLEASNSKADIVKGRAKLLDINGLEKEIGGSFSDINKNKYHFNNCFWSAIYKHEMIKTHKLYFEERKDMVIAQDILFLLKAVYFANKIRFISDVYYHYCIRQDGLTFQVYDIKKIKSFIISLNLRSDFINEHINNVEENSYIFFYGSNLQCILNEMIYNTCNSIIGSFLLIKAAIKFYDKCLYKQGLKRYLNQNLIYMLENKDEIAIFQEYIKNYKTNYSSTIWKLFDFIPLIKINSQKRYKIFYLFGFFPLLKIKNRTGGMYYKLFSVLPILRKVTKENKKWTKYYINYFFSITW